tara:strand:- start:5685 stop:6062 length:378 start_codon:yes stop_codon:yes gene_type:complete
LKTRNREILLVDDDRIINLINTKVVKTQFPEVPIKAVESGKQALDYISENPQKKYLIFLDIHMPQMTGWDFISVIKEKLNSLDLQIHILTSSIDSTDIKKAKESDQVLSYLLKPLKVDVLKSIAI